MVIPAKQKMIVELGNLIPDRGTLRIRVFASRSPEADHGIPSLRWEFGFQASNNSAASKRVSTRDIDILAPAGKPEVYEWNIALSEVTLRNPMRRSAQMGDTPNPSEYLKLHNHAVSKGDVHIDWIEITAPAFESWPPPSHRGILGDTPAYADALGEQNETETARKLLRDFMTRAWRREISETEVQSKVDLFNDFRPSCDDFQQAMIEVFATVLSSPQFLYLGLDTPAESPANEIGTESGEDFALATRLAMFLWCSIPDEELLGLARQGKLRNPGVLDGQVERMLNDPRSNRFSKQFVRQWLGMQLLDYLKVDSKTYPHFDPTLRESMQEEPIAFFNEVLRNNRSVVDFLHADYVVINERLALHYGLPHVEGSHFRKVNLDSGHPRGGLLTQAGLLAMNSDGTDSHPLKRGIWMLERILNDPPPPPPPAVPEIDLADPEIAKMTLKERMEDHRNDPACNSCHAKIDPWGIAFEHFDAVGSWRTTIRGQPVDASSQLFNREPLEGMDGLKRFLLTKRQDQFVLAMVHHLSTFALGRPLTFGDRSEVNRIAAELRSGGDGLATLVTLIVKSELFQSNRVSATRGE